ncbi:MAG: ANTAR domain-containing protein, partial [Phycisphaerales bacterium]|nr:ANTAR domain-containing protein [Phycisphaerales bacterium]
APPARKSLRPRPSEHPIGPHSSRRCIQLSGSVCIDVAKLMYERLGVPTVILSAYADPELIVQARNAGVFGYLVKPPQSAQMAAALDVAIARSSEYLKSSERTRELQRQIDERREVEQAKWLLVRNAGLTEPSAMKALQDESRRTQQPLSAVAKGVIKAGRLVPADPPKHRP